MTLDSSGMVYTFGPSRPVTALIAVGALLAGGDAVASSDPAGRLLLACVAVGLAIIAASDIIFAPRLTASAFGLAIRSPALRARFAWTELDSIRVDERPHLGLASRSLEIESGSTLVVIGKRGLGCDPRAAITTLSTCATLALGETATRLLVEQPQSDRDRAPHDDDEQHRGDPTQTA